MCSRFKETFVTNAISLPFEVGQSSFFYLTNVANDENWINMFILYLPVDEEDRR